MIDQFQELLQGLGLHIGTSLHPDKRGACQLNVNNVLHVQLEYEPFRERMLMACFLCDVPPGKLRENILRDALKANHPYPIVGTLAYSERNNKMALFAYHSLHGLTGDKLAVSLASFIEKAKKWLEAIETGQTATLVDTIRAKEHPFNLKP